MPTYRLFCNASEVGSLPAGLRVVEKYPSFVIVSGDENQIEPLRKRWVVERLDSSSKTVAKRSGARSIAHAPPGD